MSYTTYITAHSGCEGTPSDSRESLMMALELKADVAEVDVRRANNGTLIISHDWKGTYSDQVLTLREVMEIVTHYDDIILNCDIKEMETTLDVLDLAHQLKLDKQRLILSGGLTPKYLKANSCILDRCNVFLNIEEVVGEIIGAPAELTEYSLWMYLKKKIYDISPYIKEIFHICSDLGVKALNLPYIPITHPAFDLESDVPLSVWTINKPEDINKMLQMNAANITTLNVRLAMELRNTFIAT